MYDLEERTVLLTGGATGIGRTLTTRFAAEGCRVGLIDVNMDEARRTAELVQRNGRELPVYEADVSNPEQLASAVDRFIQRFGRIDVLINNAGAIHVGKVADTSLADWRRVFGVNVEGPFILSKLVMPHMMKQGEGKIINIASYIGKIGRPYYGAYCASKSAVISFTQTLALELAAHKINVNAICPGTIEGTMMSQKRDIISKEIGIPTGVERSRAIPLGRMGTTDDIANAALFLASNASSYMTGQAINVTGGLWLN
jgi:NAD(P)-dependent dehydrogenase (short-subunit alcohol dehydrogenase family)